PGGRPARRGPGGSVLPSGAGARQREVPRSLAQRRHASVSTGSGSAATRASVARARNRRAVGLNGGNMEHSVDRRAFLEGAVAGAATLAWPRWPARASRGLDDIQTEIERRHQEAVARPQQWIHQPSIAAENRGVAEGCDLTMQLLRDAGFNQVTKVPTDGQPGIFATLDAGAPRTLGVYFMYDVKQVDPAEWSSPPWAASLVDKPGVGTVVVG